mmetsp:Transcript_37560/g.82407  ORF Transcript_37560/g.82407 Transcript_37560/m.82407 type:complete len:448 (-) Transcript_37560:145-1488(-)
MRRLRSLTPDAIQGDRGRRRARAETCPPQERTGGHWLSDDSGAEGSGRGSVQLMVLMPVLPERPRRTEAQVASIGTSWVHGTTQDVPLNAAAQRTLPDSKGEYRGASGSYEATPTAKHDACGICLGQFSPGDELTALPCAEEGCPSIWHSRCVRTWLCEGHTQTCPLCRADVAGDGTEGGPSVPQMSFAFEVVATMPLRGGVQDRDLLHEFLLLTLLPMSLGSLDGIGGFVHQDNGYHMLMGGPGGGDLAPWMLPDRPPPPRPPQMPAWWSPWSSPRVDGGRSGGDSSATPRGVPRHVPNVSGSGAAGHFDLFPSWRGRANVAGSPRMSMLPPPPLPPPTPPPTPPERTPPTPRNVRPSGPELRWRQRGRLSNFGNGGGRYVATPASPVRGHGGPAGYGHSWEAWATATPRSTTPLYGPPAPPSAQWRGSPMITRVPGMLPRGAARQ